MEVSGNSTQEAGGILWRTRNFLISNFTLWKESPTLLSGSPTWACISVTLVKEQRSGTTSKFMVWRSGEERKSSPSYLYPRWQWGCWSGNHTLRTVNSEVWHYVKEQCQVVHGGGRGGGCPQAARRLSRSGRTLPPHASALHINCKFIKDIWRNLEAVCGTDHFSPFSDCSWRNKNLRGSLWCLEKSAGFQVYRYVFGPQVSYLPNGRVTFFYLLGLSRL